MPGSFFLFTSSPCLQIKLVKCVLVFLEAEDFSRGRGSLLSFISGFMECISEMDFLWQDLIPHVVGTFISQALSNFHLAHFLHLEHQDMKRILNSLENLHITIHGIKLLPFYIYNFDIEDYVIKGDHHSGEWSNRQEGTGMKSNNFNGN